jgi:hypothetical protein
MSLTRRGPVAQPLASRIQKERALFSTACQRGRNQYFSIRGAWCGPRESRVMASKADQFDHVTLLMCIAPIAGEKARFWRVLVIPMS